MAEESGSSDPKSEIMIGDPGEFLLTNSKYHDCYLTVGNPEADEVEKIGVLSTQLIAHSPVFRDMLADSKLADPSGSNTHITDVSPSTFKLMLRHIFGGKLPNMTPAEAAELALCGDKYNIPRLVYKAAKRLKPLGAGDVFPALQCIAYISCPSLEREVSKIVQQQTDKIVESSQFLDLDENCVLFIAKQDMLNINEVDLWKNLVRWAHSKVDKHPEMSLRDYLEKSLKHVRLLSLSLEEIEEYVIPNKILTVEEYVDLTCAVAKKQLIKSSILCNVNVKRYIYGETSILSFKNNIVFDARLRNTHSVMKDTKICSTFSIKPNCTIMIDSFTVKNEGIDPNNSEYDCVYKLVCKIVITKSVNGFMVCREESNIEGIAIQNEDIILPVKPNVNKPLILNASETCTFTLKFNVPHTVYELRNYNKCGYENKTFTPLTTEQFTITYKDYIHVFKIDYQSI